MELKFKQSLTYDAYLEFAKFYYLKKMSLSTKITYLVIFLVGIVNLIYRIIIQQQVTALNIWVTVVFCGLPFLVNFLHRRNLKKNYKTLEEAYSDVEYVFHNDRMSVTTFNQNKYETLYDNLKMADENDSSYYLFITEINAYIIEKSQIPESLRDDFRQLFNKIRAQKSVGEHLVQ